MTFWKKKALIEDFQASRCNQNRDNQNLMEYCQNIDEPKATEGQTDFFTNVLPKGSSNTKKSSLPNSLGGGPKSGHALF